jgi:amidophosphoribosyltransferase
MPGEAIYITNGGNIHLQQCAGNPQYSSCIFEYVYFARPDSIIDNVWVHKARMRMGHKLADCILQNWPDHDIDVVIPIPDTSRTAAAEIALMLDVKFREGFIKNRYIGRTFIMPGQTKREKSVRQKLNPIDLEFKGKNVLLVDDSIVRGTTSREIVQMARSSGAKKVYFASAAPAVRYPNIYGIDMPAASELIAHDRTDEEVADLMGVDRLIYQSLEDLIASVREGDTTLEKFDCSVFDGKYVMDEGREYFEKIEAQRNDLSRNNKGDTIAIDLSDAAEKQNY